MYRLARVSTGLLLLFSLSCGTGKKPRYIAGDDTLTSGTIHVSIDESFRPVMDSQIRVFMSLHPEARIIAHYKPEADCIRDLADDSTRLVVITRGLSEDEEAYYEDTLQFRPRFGSVARDAIAVIVNERCPDSLFSVAEIRSMLNGTSGRRYRQVMDGTVATSTVRFLLDSVLQGQPFGASVVAARTSEGVIDYVAGHPDAIGYLGVGWIGNPEDTAQLSFLKRVRIAALQCANCEEEVYVRPYQANMALGRYPLTRELYYVLKENYPGLGRGFVNFLKHEQGQLVFKRAYLVPEWKSLQVRRVNLKE